MDKYIWLTEEFHGYNYVFSTWEKAYAWLEKEKQDVGDDEDDKYEIEIEFGVHAYVGYEGDLVGRIERLVLDEQAV